MLDEIRRVTSETRESIREHIEIIVAGDFNRHDPLWGGERATGRFRNEGEPIIDPMDDLGLQNLLPEGTITFESGYQGTTIDLILTTERLAAEVVVCITSGQEYGSDHRAIITEFDA